MSATPDTAPPAPLKILIPVHFFLPDHSAGTEVYTYNLARALVARGHQVSVFASEKLLSRRSWSLLRREVDGLPVHVVVNNLDYDNFAETFSNSRAEGAFQRVLDEVRPDIVHVQHLMLLSLGLPALARASGARVLMTLNDFWLFCARFGQLLLPGGQLCDGPTLRDCANCLQDFNFTQGTPEKAVIRMLAATRELTGVDLAPLVYWAQDRSRLLKRRRQANPDKRSRAGADTDLEAGLAARQRKVGQLIDHVDLFLSPSHTVAERVVDWGIPRNRIVVSRYGIDITPFRDARDQERPDRPITFGYVGTLAPHKGVHVLLEAVRRLPAGSCKLLVFGSDSHFGDYGRMLRELAEERDVEFRGPLERARIGEAFAAIDCLVMPSLWLENSPVVIQEAFAAGVPVIASGQGGMAELIVDGRSGRLFKAGDIGALVLHMASILANPTTLRQWSVTMDAPRTIEDDAAQLEQIYGELLAGTWQPPATGGKGRRTARLRPAADDDDD